MLAVPIMVVPLKYLLYIIMLNKQTNKETVETSNQTTYRPDLELGPTVGFEEHGLRSKGSPSPFNDVAVQLEELYE